MFLFDEKRKLNERRMADRGAPAGRRERRAAEDRRQTSISEIPFSEWASHLVEFRKHAMARKSGPKAPNSTDASKTTGINRRFFPNS